LVRNSATTSDHGIARRANAILLLDDGKSCQEITDFLYLDGDTIRGWHKTCQRDGWDALAVDGWKGGQSRMMSAQEAALCTWLEGRFCRSTVEIRSHIVSEFGLEYSHSGCIKPLARLEDEYRKPKALPRAVPAERQEEFIALCSRLLNDPGKDEAVYFAPSRDIAAQYPAGLRMQCNPEYQTKPAFGWVKQGSHPAVKTTAGRGRVNIHGALNLETFDAPFCCGDHRRWGQRRAASRQDRSPQPRQAHHSCDLGQCRIP
jgi:transposase